MNSKNKLTDNLKRLRKDYSLTQDEVADIISKDRSSVAKYESEPDAVPKRGPQYAKLSKQEQLIVLKFRMMNEKEKSDLIEKINEITAESDTE